MSHAPLCVRKKVRAGARARRASERARGRLGSHGERGEGENLVVRDRVGVRREELLALECVEPLAFVKVRVRQAHLLLAW